MSKYVFFVVGIVVSVVVGTYFGWIVHQNGLPQNVSLILSGLLSFIVSWNVAVKFDRWDD